MYPCLLLWAEMLRVEEPLRRCWDKDKYLKDPKKRDTLPLGVDDEYKRLGCGSVYRSLFLGGVQLQLHYELCLACRYKAER